MGGLSGRFTGWIATEGRSALFAVGGGLLQTFKHCQKIACKLMINKVFIVFEALQTFSNIANILQTRSGFKHSNIQTSQRNPCT
jgi:hypothetical protein